MRNYREIKLTVIEFDGADWMYCFRDKPAEVQRGEVARHDYTQFGCLDALAAFDAVRNGAGRRQEVKQ